MSKAKELVFLNVEKMMKSLLKSAEGCKLHSTLKLQVY